MVVRTIRKQLEGARLRLAGRGPTAFEPSAADFDAEPRLEPEGSVAPDPRLPPDFDPEQYISLHEDLEVFRGAPEKAIAHYLELGEIEERPYKPPDLETLREIECGQLPADFDADLYIDLHPDLEPVRGSPAEARAHYLEVGRSEGRSYRPLSKRAREELEVPGRGERTDEDGLAADPPWAARFNAADFRALNPDLAAEVTDWRSALSVFAEKGIERVAPLSLDDRFDPDFYRSFFEDVRDLGPAEAYRHWLSEGLRLERPGSEAEMIANLTGSASYPAAFDWQAYAARTPGLDPERPFARVRALEHLLGEGLETVESSPVKGNPASFLELVSDRLWKAFRRAKAIALLEQAVTVAPSDGRLLTKLGDRLQELGNIEAAADCYKKAHATGFRSVWVYKHLIETAAQLERFEEAYDWLAQSRSGCSGYGPWHSAFATTLELNYAHEAGAAWELYRRGERDAGDARMEAVLSRITQAFRDLDDLPAPLPPRSDGHVVLFANHGLPQCLHYRVEQKCEQLDLLGIPFRLFSDEEAVQARQALVGARTLIVYRQPAFPPAIRLMLHARAMGVPVLYEIDDLIFDAAHYPGSYESFDNLISIEEYVGLLYGVPLFRFALSLADGGIASTSALANAIAPLTLAKRCDVLANGLDSRNNRFLRSGPPPRTDDEVFVFYGSGTKAHNRDFNDIVGPALVALMEARPQVRLVVVGYLDLAPIFEGVAQRVIRCRFTKDLAAYWALLSEVDISLAVLVPGTMNDCKSEIKWMEAAVSGVPSVVSASATYAEVVRDGIDGFIARDSGEWRDALFRLVDHPELRRAVGERAKARVAKDYALATTAARLGQILEAPGLPLRAEKAVAPARKRILVVNVFFPPQTFGGATRVVRDNIDDLLARYPEAFELAVVTTDFDAEPGAFDVGQYHTVPVFRLGRNEQAEFAYRDEAMGDRFAEILDAWRPDLVHFHSIQFLTGAIAERCAAARIPYVVTAHDAWWISPFQFLVDEHYFLRLPQTRALAEQTGAAADLENIDRRRYLADRLSEAAAVTAVSRSFAEIYRAAGFEQTRAIPNGISSDFVGHARQGRAARDRVCLGFVGGRSYHKGLHLLRAALQDGDFEHLHLVLIEYDRQASFEAQDRWGSTPVTIRGLVPQHDMMKLYESLDVLVAPSIWPESFGLVAREAAAMGLWVVASGLGALADDILDGQNGFVIDVQDSRDLRHVLGIIDADPERFLRPPPVSQVLRTAAEQTDDLVALYREILGSRPAEVPAGRRSGSRAGLS